MVRVEIRECLRVRGVRKNLKGRRWTTREAGEIIDNEIVEVCQVVIPPTTRAKEPSLSTHGIRVQVRRTNRQTGSSVLEEHDDYSTRPKALRIG